MKHPQELWGALPPGIREFATKMATGAVLGAATAGLKYLMGNCNRPSSPRRRQSRRREDGRSGSSIEGIDIIKANGKAAVEPRDIAHAGRWVRAT